MTTLRMQPVHIIGGGLAGCQAAWQIASRGIAVGLEEVRPGRPGAARAGTEPAGQIASRGIPVLLHAMRPVRTTAAHKTESLAELVCSNSFRSEERRVGKEWRYRR